MPQNGDVLTTVILTLAVVLMTVAASAAAAAAGHLLGRRFRQALPWLAIAVLAEPTPLYVGYLGWASAQGRL